jgi:5-methylcytosine-specific restriction endonuclease McrA
MHQVVQDESHPTAEIGTNVEYSCVIGGRQSVYNPLLRTSSVIGNYPFDVVLSKDGNPHKIVQKHRFLRHPISAVSIRTREGRNPLVVTSDHLILLWRDGRVIWEQASAVTKNDLVFGKRSKYAVTDNSNRTSFLCPCGSIFWRTNSALNFYDAHYCSTVCRHKYGEHNFNEGMHWELSEESRAKHRGENNPQWRDGSCLRPYDSNFNGWLKERVKERDGFQCQVCHNTFDLVVHHQDWDKMNSSIDNLITLCRPCHGQLNRQDCELPEVSLRVFKPKPILEIQQYTIKRDYKESIPHLYDFTVGEEDSFMVSGLLVHNSYLEFGTAHHAPFPFLFPAVEMQRSAIIEALKGREFNID